MQAFVDWGSILRDAPRECWLALNEDETRIVGSGPTIEEAVAQAQAAGVEDPILLWSPKEVVPAVYSGFAIPSN